MTKSTKIIAALGVAAGLGIAALPAGAIFATNDLSTWPMAYPGASSENVTVELNVAEGIAIGVSASNCVGDSDGTESGVQSFSVSDAGECAMELAGGTNKPNGFTVSVKTTTGKTSYLVLDGKTTNPTDQQKIVAKSGTLGVDSNANAGWNITGGELTTGTAAPEADAATGAEVMRTAAPKQVQIPMTYHFATRNDQEAGHYSTQITYTIAANDASVTTEAGVDNPTRVHPTN